MTEIEIRITGVDLDDPDTLKVLHTQLCDYLWTDSGGLVTFTVFAGEKPVDDAINALRRVRNHLPDATPQEVHREEVTISEIAHRVRVSREAVRKWVTNRKENGFPAPTQRHSSAERGSMGTWYWRDVIVWLACEKAIDMDQELPDFDMVTEINEHIAGRYHKASEGTWQTADAFGRPHWVVVPWHESGLDAGSSAAESILKTRLAWT